MKISFNGLIEKGWDYEEIIINGECIADELSGLDGEMAKLTYYISESPIDEDKIVEDFLTSFYEGKTEADGNYICGSSWTGVYAKRDTLSVGGHDITEELSSHVGKYCYLIIETA